MLHWFLKFYDGQFHGEGFEIIFYDNIAFGDQFVPVVQVAQADLRSRVGIVLGVDDILNDDVVGGYGYADGQGGLVIEFIVFDGILHQGLHRDRGDEEVFGREVRDLDDHADGVAETYFEQVEIVADEFYFFS